MIVLKAPDASGQRKLRLAVDYHYVVHFVVHYCTKAYIDDMAVQSDTWQQHFIAVQVYLRVTYLFIVPRSIEGAARY